MKINLIVIDDDKEFQNEPFFIDVRENFPDMDIYFFENSETAIPFINEKINSTEKIIILLDLMFPESSQQGTDILKIIREKSFLIPVMVLTAADDDLKVTEDLINYKTTAFVRKTLSISERIDILKSIVEFLNSDIPSAIDEWIGSNPEERRNMPYIATSDGKSYTLNEILKEIRQETIIGKEFTNNLLKLTVDLVSRNKEKLHD
jgi:CheY-like chemotaxis protein